MEGLPRYFIVFATPVKVLKTDQGEMAALKLSWETGKFEDGIGYLNEILFGRDEVEEVTRDEFVQAVEKIRGSRLKGAGTVYDLYEVINGLEETARQAGRGLTPKEQATIAGLREQTYQLFEKKT